MIACILQYLLCYVNLGCYGFFTIYSLCRAKEDSYDNRIKVLICGPFVSLAFTALVATIHLI